MTIDQKLDALRENLRTMGGVAIAFSGGVDSAFLVAVAQEALGERALAITALSPTFSSREQHEAAQLAKSLGVRHETVKSDELAIPNFAENPVDRCYYCKKELFTVLGAIAKRHGITALADGSNADDLGDHRPGMRAAKELGVHMPLLTANLGKDEIRELSRRMRLPTADKPSLACLASRFPYGSRITETKLVAVDRVEEALRALGYRQLRVRHHGDTARIELEQADISRACETSMRKKISRAAKDAGFLYVALDLDGYRTGSMNERNV